MDQNYPTHSIIYSNPQVYPYIHAAIYFLTFIWKKTNKKQTKKKQQQKKKKQKKKTQNGGSEKAYVAYVQF